MRLNIENWSNAIPYAILYSLVLLKLSIYINISKLNDIGVQF